jgi:hypothetical protein
VEAPRARSIKRKQRPPAELEKQHPELSQFRDVRSPETCHHRTMVAIYFGAITTIAEHDERPSRR